MWGNLLASFVRFSLPYATVSYSLSQRTREIGIRVALGADRSRLLWWMVGQGMQYALAGVVIGLVAALFGLSVMSSFLFEVAPTDPLTFAVVSVLLLGAALLACYIPARRATTVDPMSALRQE